MEQQELETYEEIVSQEADVTQKDNKDGEEGDGKNYATTYYVVLLKQKIAELVKLVEWRKANVKVLSSKQKAKAEQVTMSM